MHRIIVAFVSFSLLLCGCTSSGLVQSGQTGGVLVNMDDLPPNTNSTGIQTVLVSEVEVESVAVDEYNHQSRIPVTRVKLNYQDPPMGDCMGPNVPIRFIGIESDSEHPIPSGTTMMLSIDSLDFIKTIRCEYVCSVPRFIWEELPLDYTPDMEIEVVIEGLDLSEAWIKAGGLVVIVNADIINNDDDQDDGEVKAGSNSLQGSN